VKKNVIGKKNEIETSRIKTGPEAKCEEEGEKRSRDREMERHKE